MKMGVEMNMPAADGDAAPRMTVVAETTESLKFLTTEQRAAQRAENKKQADKPEKGG